MIRILIVDDSNTEILLLKHIFESEKDMQVIGIANNGEEAVKMTLSLKPDLISMDLLMPVMNGVDATKSIMTQQPTPIVVISSAVNEDIIDSTFQALEAGALSVIEKPSMNNKNHFEKTRKRIIDTVRSMAEIKVIKRRFAIKPLQKKIKKLPTFKIEPRAYELIAIGTSIGGPQALKTILSQMPHDFPVPIVIVQHMTKGFIEGFTHWLNQQCSLSIKCADNHEVLQDATVYFAPDQYHLTIKRFNGRLMTHLIKSEPVSGFCPSATVLLQSVAEVCGKNAIGILLTGMGSDGAQGLLALKNAKAHTLIQDPKSTVVFGMAGVAHSLGAADRVVELDLIADYLIKIVKK